MPSTLLVLTLRLFCSSRTSHLVFTLQMASNVQSASLLVFACHPADAHQPNQHVKQIILLPFEKEFQRFANYCGAVYDLNRISLPTFGRPVQGREYAQGLVFKTRPSKGNDAASGMCIHCCYLFCLADTMLLPSTSDHSRSKAASSCYA